MVGAVVDVTTPAAAGAVVRGADVGAADVEEVDVAFSSLRAAVCGAAAAPAP